MSAVLQPTQGVLGLTGSLINEIARDGITSVKLTGNSPLALKLVTRPPYHIALLFAAELREIPQERLANIEADTSQVFNAGVGGNVSNGVFFVVVIWAAGQQLRKRLGFPPKQFHITLSTRDDHDMDKGIESLLPGQFPAVPTPEFLDDLAYTLHISGQYQGARAYCTALILLLPDSHKGYLGLADAALWAGHHKLAMLSYSCAFERAGDENIKHYCVKKLVECSRETEWGSVVLKHEIAQLPVEIAPMLLAPWSLE